MSPILQTDPEQVLSAYSSIHANCENAPSTGAELGYPYCYGTKSTKRGHVKVETVQTIKWSKAIAIESKQFNAQVGQIPFWKTAGL